MNTLFSSIIQLFRPDQSPLNIKIESQRTRRKQLYGFLIHNSDQSTVMKIGLSIIAFFLMSLGAFYLLLQSLLESLPTGSKRWLFTLVFFMLLYINRLIFYKLLSGRLDANKRAQYRSMSRSRNRELTTMILTAVVALLAGTAFAYIVFFLFIREASQ